MWPNFLATMGCRYNFHVWFAPYTSRCDPTFLLPWGVEAIFRYDLHYIQAYATQLSCYHGVLTNFQVWFSSHTNGCNPTFFLPWVWQSFQVWCQPHANVCNPTCLLPWGVECMVNYYILKWVLFIVQKS